MNKEKINITVDSEVLEVVDALANEDSRSRSQMINLLLKRQLQSEERQDKGKRSKA